MTVYLSQVSAAHVTDLKLIPCVDDSSVQVTVSGSSAAANMTAHVGIFYPNNGTKVREIYKPFLSQIQHHSIPFCKVRDGRRTAFGKGVAKRT